MIIKHSPMLSAIKSSFESLVNYLTNDKQTQSRVADINCANVHNPDDLDLALAEVWATQSLNRTAKDDKTYHLIISFRNGDNPSPAQLKEIEQMTCAAIGLGDHQRVSVLHDDTDNLHLHVAVNKIHPKTHKMRIPWQAYKRFAEIAEICEQKFGLEPDNHIPKHRLSETKIREMERITGKQSLSSYARENLKLSAITNWQQLHKTLAESGMIIRRKGAGLVIIADNGIACKASTVDRALSIKALTDKLGEWQDPVGIDQIEKKRSYTRSYIGNGDKRIDRAELYLNYQAELFNATTAKRDDLARLIRTRNNEILKIKASAKRKRGLVKLLKADSWARKLMYRQIHKSMIADIEKLKRDARIQKSQIIDKHAVGKYEDWLKRQAIGGRGVALDALRSRQRAMQHASNHITGSENKPAVSRPKADTTTSTGTLIYRTGSGSVRDTGKQIQLGRGTDDETIKTALMLARERFGNRLEVSGTLEYKKQLVRVAANNTLPVRFADSKLEKIRLQLTQKILQEKRHDGYVRRRSVGNAGRAGRGTHIRTDTSLSRTVAAVISSRGGNPVAAPHAVGFAGGQAPQSLTGVRSLSVCGVVSFPKCDQVFLQSHAPDVVDNRRTQRDSELRRGATPSARRRGKRALLGAAETYIAERNEKRTRIADIREHALFCPPQTETNFVFVALRKIDGQDLLLIRDPEQERILVQEIKPEIAYRLRNVSRGKQLVINQKHIRPAGRSR
jgi:hypothetical protein